VTAAAADEPLRAVGLDDPVRLAAVERVLAAGGRSEGLDRLTALAAKLLRTAHAQVSLLTREQVVASVVGREPVPSSDGSLQTGRREDSLCTVTARSGGPLAVSDAVRDPRVRTLPPVTSGAVGAYLGVPLVDRNGLLLGALCVYDPEPRPWSIEQVGILDELAPAVVAELELRAVTLDVATAAARLDLALASADIGSFDWDLETDELQCDERLVALFGYDRAQFRPHISSFSERLHPDDVARVERAVERAKTIGELAVDYRIVRPEGDVRWVEARGRVLRTGGGRADRMLGAAYDATARHTAQAERERAYREREEAVLERERAYAQAEAANARLSLLADAATRLSGSLVPADVLEALASTVVPSLGRWLVVAVVGEAASMLLPVAEAADPDAVHTVFARHSDARQQAALEALLASLPLSLDDEHGVGAAIRTGVPEWLPEVSDEVLSSFGFPDEQLAAVRALQVGTALTVPLVSRGRRLGALAVAEPATGLLDRALLVDLAGRAAVALDNALLYGQERRTGITLQRSLLPRELPEVPDVEVAVRYLPGADGAFVGGDWYQGVLVEDQLVLAMGDVMGHGMRSAARMGQLRAIVATLALEGHSPTALLSRLARSSSVLLDLDLATLLVGRYDPRTRRLVVASAGHPPPLLAPLGQEPHFLDVDPGPPLGTFDDDYPEVEVDVPAGATLVMYTDGLVENREEPLQCGLDRLRDALRNVTLPPELAADHVLARTGRTGGADDDVALLVLSHRGDGGGAAA
jgi:PAS domain S-box-containing protein